MTLDAFLADPGSRFATVAMTDTGAVVAFQLPNWREAAVFGGFSHSFR